MLTLKTLIAGSLMGQNTPVTYGQFIILIPLYLQLQTLAVFLLESNVVRMSMVVVSVAMMVMRLSSHINDGCRPRQHRRILIFYELCDAFTDDPEEQNEPDDYKYLHSLFPFLKSIKDLTHM